MNKQVSIEEAARLVHDGDLITIGGTLSQRVPAAFVREIARHGVCGLQLIKASPGYDLDLLAAAGCVVRVRCGIAGLEQPFGMAPSFRRAVESGRLEVIENACPAVMASLQAAAFGIPFQPVTGFDGSDIPSVSPFAKVKDPFTGKSIFVVPAVRPEWAIIHVHEADQRGNACIYGTPVWDRLLSRAAKKCIVITERLLPTEHFIARPELTVIPELLVQAVVHVPLGAWPTAVLPDYDLDEAAVHRYLELSATGDGLVQYLSETLARDHATREDTAMGAAA